MVNSDSEFFYKILCRYNWFGTVKITHTWAHINETLMFELGQLRHRIESIRLCNSQYRVLPPMTVFAQRCEIILVWASQNVVKGPTKSWTLTSCADSLGPVKYRINTRFLSIYVVNLKSYLGNIVLITACLLGYIYSCIL